jgi:hypothetical protein
LKSNQQTNGGNIKAINLKDRSNKPWINPNKSNQTVNPLAKGINPFSNAGKPLNKN